MDQFHFLFHCILFIIWYYKSNKLCFHDCHNIDIHCGSCFSSIKITCFSIFLSKDNTDKICIYDNNTFFFLLKFLIFFFINFNHISKLKKTFFPIFRFIMISEIFSIVTIFIFFLFIFR